MDVLGDSSEVLPSCHWIMNLAPMATRIFTLVVEVNDTSRAKLEELWVVLLNIPLLDKVLN